MSEMAQAYDAMPEKSGAHDQLTIELGRLSDLIERLEHRLTPVLNPPSPHAAPSSETPVRSPLRDHAFRLAAHNNKLSEVLDRLDL
jgi:hypothetical protein